MKTPVFDIGDTLIPSSKLQNELIDDVFRENGEEVPHFNVNNFRIYNPSHVERYMEKHGLSGTDPEEVVKRYEEREKHFMEKKGVFKFLRKCSEKFGKIGFISDNSQKGKEWFRDQLESHEVPYKGLVVSEEVGVEKPETEIFEAFVEKRDSGPGKFVYFGNNLERDPACRKVGMSFVLVEQYKVFGKNEDYEKIGGLEVQRIAEKVNRNVYTSR
ncbi:MAG: HAD family hydrolase [Nanohaloarchaea archaeon]|nr:HAD family hydrolase [Candidatus Nanohaloarchaea archaeon]